MLLRSWKFWISLAILLVFAVVVERSYGWIAVLASWQRISAAELAVAVTLMLVSYLLRAFRFYDFFNSYCHGHWWRLTRITVLHNFFNNLLPMRSGEAAFPMLMKTHFSCPVRHSLPALLWLRLLDLYVLLALAVWTLSDLPGNPISVDPAHVWLWQAGLLVLPLLVLPVQNRIRQLLASHPGSVANKLADLMQALPSSPWPFIRALLWTLVNWVLKLAIYAWVLQQFITLSFGQSWVGASTGELSSILPIHGVAGAGTYEAGIVAGLLPWQLDTAAVLAAAVNLHLFVLGCTLLLTAIITLATSRLGNRHSSTNT
ncbi:MULTISPECIES: lysylphosphatidylglycerol synthase domain-containing protein [unclassified Oceanobacter]|uniref:lysylphosphatidylglycerol synthase domain-containing protein n=1 Tax=unclassified Oceanobacter TaxID=2620260 RepID=UPI0027335302|nr:MULTISPECIES: lysylphosphatidylglycerol synthase domain-containing protein [unclassified Oceanobacter]MDP2548848.1 lysylphosphatidylglycerol synthase domain-containing protein [Oceanobacter sp. 4_MG-2023]MDP2609611.1 lysylphosphatidylglycerol synthase domain-containing protein [Oceanobacter sp. 1_MG-2023]MDP2612694.1 lysylphosphatidylglycerol synthase domain-containing protein [Oceanobacter sp. 2_MG-2023]